MEGFEFFIVVLSIIWGILGLKTICFNNVL